MLIMHVMHIVHIMHIMHIMHRLGKSRKRHERRSREIFRIWGNFPKYLSFVAKCRIFSLRTFGEIFPSKMPLVGNFGLIPCLIMHIMHHINHMHVIHSHVTQKVNIRKKGLSGQDKMPHTVSVFRSNYSSTFLAISHFSLFLITSHHLLLHHSWQEKGRGTKCRTP